MVGDPNLEAADQYISDILTQDLNYGITIADDNGITESAASGKDLIILSSSVDHGIMGNTFVNTAVPILLFDKELQDDLGMISTAWGDRGSTTLGAIDIIDPTHPLAGDMEGIVQLFSSAQITHWGVPNANASIIAQKVNSTSAIYYGYESGAVMPGLTAPARRVFCFPDKSATAALTSRGKQMISAAIQWTAGDNSIYPSNKDRVLLVAEKADLSSDGDAVFLDVLENELGYNVVIKDENNISTADATGKALILISSSVQSGKIGNTFTQSAVPVLNCEPHLLDDLGMISASAAKGSSNSQDIEIIDLSHEIVEGMLPTTTVYTLVEGLTYGVADPSAHVIAQVPSDPGKAVIFYYQPGESMPGLVAPARRMSLFPFDNGPNVLTATGREILIRAIQFTHRGYVQKKTFLGKYGSAADGFYHAHELANGNYLVLGSGSHSGTGPSAYDFHAIRLDTYGNILSESVYESPLLQEDTENRLNHNISTVASNGDVLTTIEGRYHDGTNWAGCTDPIVLRLDQAGE